MKSVLSLQLSVPCYIETCGERITEERERAVISTFLLSGERAFELFAESSIKLTLRLLFVCLLQVRVLNHPPHLNHPTSPLTALVIDIPQKRNGFATIDFDDIRYEAGLQ